MELLAISVGLGLVVGVLFTELFGLAPAGLIVPGYLALYLTDFPTLLLTLAVATASYVIVRIVSTLVILHGRRRVALMILVGYALALLVSQGSTFWGPGVDTIGFVIPGLIALGMDKQGVRHTLGSLFLLAVAVRLLLILTVGMEGWS